MLDREEPRDVLPVLEDELADPEEDRGLLRQRRRPPCGKGRFGGLDRTIDVLRAREVDGTRLPAERRVVDRAASARFALDDAAADPVADPLDLLRLLDGWCRQLGHLILLT